MASVHTTGALASPPSPSPSIAALAELALAGAMSRWFKPPKNQRESGSSSGRRAAPSRTSSLPPPPPPPGAFGNAPRGVRAVGAAVPARRAVAAEAAPKKKRMRRYVRVAECWWHWNNATPVAWPDVHLPDDWHLNPQ